jgi:hypothetical protein
MLGLLIWKSEGRDEDCRFFTMANMAWLAMLAIFRQSLVFGRWPARTGNEFPVSSFPFPETMIILIAFQRRRLSAKQRIDKKCEGRQILTLAILAIFENFGSLRKRTSNAESQNRRTGKQGRVKRQQATSYEDRFPFPETMIILIAFLAVFGSRPARRQIH